jgi:hypothetical protein
MSFLAPLFLLGAVAVAAPIIFHLIRRTSREKMPFSSLMFLEQTPPRMTRQNRLENIFLLILRCLILLLLALGFARPFFQKPVAADPTAGEGRRVVVLVDASASMKQENLWAEARRKAEQAVRSASPADTVAVLLFDRAARPLVSTEQWTSTPVGDRAALVTSRLADAQPGWSGTHLGNALASAVETLEDTSRRDAQRPAAGPRRIILISDLQEGAHLDGLQGFEWPRGVEVVLEPLKPKRPTNAGLQVVLDRAEGDKPADDGFKVRVVNASTAKREQFQVGWVRPGDKSFAAAPVDAYVPPGQSRVFTAPKIALGLAAEQLRLTGDDEEFDDNVFLVRPKPEQIQVLFLGSDAERDPQQSLFYYLKRGFQETRQQNVQVLARPANSPLAPADLANVPFLIIGDVLSPEAARSVRGFLDSGKTALLAMRTTGAAATLAEIASLGSLSAEEATGGYALLGQIDFEHPLFAAFADPRFSDFTKIHFWKHRRLDASQLKNARMLARFDNGDPALLQLPIGKGNLFVLTTAWNPGDSRNAGDSQLALSSKFVPLLYSMLELSGGIKAQLAQYLVSDPVTFSSTNAAQPFVVRKPDGSEVKVAAGDPFTQTDQPGVYTASAGGQLQRFAVNLDPSESRTAPLPLEELERLGLPLKPQSPEKLKKEQEKRVLLQSAEIENRQKVWRWLLVAAIVVLLMETVVAAWATRRASARAG